MSLAAAITFADRQMPAPLTPAFAMPDHWVWGGSVIRDDDGCFHMFVSRWPRGLPFAQGYVVRSEVVRAVADCPEGPYRFADVVLPPRAASFWDGRMTHNPSVVRVGSGYALFYIGTTFEEPPPSDVTAMERIDRSSAYRRIRVGVALADTPAGPWRRLDAPLLDVTDGWDSVNITNPAACVRPDGGVLLVYRSSWEGKHGRAMLGAAVANRVDGPYRRVSSEPVLALESDQAVEDPFIWHSGERFEMVAKDLTGNLCGQFHGGIHATSEDGKSWAMNAAPLAWSRTVYWANGTTSTLGCRERPQLLVENGRPTHLFNAAADGPGGFHHATRTWNMVVPLAEGGAS